MDKKRGVGRPSKGDRKLVPISLRLSPDVVGLMKSNMKDILIWLRPMIEIEVRKKYHNSQKG